MKTRDEALILSIVLVNMVAAYESFIAAPTEAHMGELYRILYVHVPTAWICYLTLFVSFVSSIFFLWKRKGFYDLIAEASAILGLLYGAATIIIGSIWANAVWGVYWNWDPRETTTLILWIAYLGYISLRLSLPEDFLKRGVLSGTYNILAFSTVPLSYLSIRLWQSLHPQIITSTEIALTQPMIETLALNLLASSLVWVYLFKKIYDLRVFEGVVVKLTFGKEV